MNISKSIPLIAAGLLFASTCAISADNKQDKTSQPSSPQLPSAQSGGNPVGSSQNAAPSTTSSQIKTGDRKFMEEAARDGQAEVEMSKLAANKASSNELKKFAQQMVDEHSKTNDELQQIAKSKGLMLPTAPDAAHQQTLKRLQGLSGPEFDRRYMAEAGVKDHQATQKLFQKEATQGQDPDVKAFAEKNLPAITHHLEMARTIADTKKSASK